MSREIVILGVFVADTSYRAERMPRIGETILGNSFVLGPGGKGSNQAVAAAKAGGNVHFVTRLGKDPFADIALETWTDAGVTPVVTQHGDSYTGAAFIFVDDKTGDNAIIVSPGAAREISAEDIEARRNLIEGASVLVTQLEQPIDAACRALEIARDAGVRTILNPAPAADLPSGMLSLCDFVTPNESEAEGITGIPVASVEDAERAAEAFVAAGAGAAIITLGENGAFYKDASESVHVPAVTVGEVVETTGAGDAFNGGFAAALAEGQAPVDAVRFACAAAGISVTRPGTAPSMPSRREIDTVLANDAGGA
ncbi:MAG: ribokinase [Boseongicola sp. SB0676_bin_33]|nr:ribokinase [Boseongicola sp. SB0676_bin_33]